MKSFHIAHVIPEPKMHGLNGYKEVIETVEWGLQQLGHSVTYAVNEFSSEATNIVFGAQVLPLDKLQSLPNDTVVYNFEQIRGITSLREEAKSYASRFQIWEYSQANMEAWSRLETRHPVKHVPVGYAPILTRIPKVESEDIDVLIYGLACPTRLNLFYGLSTRGVAVVFLSGIYGSARDELISRSKIVLNVNMYEHSEIFEIVRTSYLMANRKVVVSDRSPRSFIEPDIEHALKFAAFADVGSEVMRLLDDPTERERLGDLGYEAIRRRDVVEILRSALEC